MFYNFYKIRTLIEFGALDQHTNTNGTNLLNNNTTMKNTLVNSLKSRLEELETELKKNIHSQNELFKKILGYTLNTETILENIKFLKKPQKLLK